MMQRLVTVMQASTFPRGLRQVRHEGGTLFLEDKRCGDVAIIVALDLYRLGSLWR